MKLISLNTAAKVSQKIIKAFKKENVFNSKTFNAIMDKDWGKGSKAICAKSKTTGKPVDIFVKDKSVTIGGCTNYYYTLYDKSGKKIGSKSFGIELRPDSKAGNEMHYGVMENTPCDIAGAGVIEDAIQIETALKNGIKVIPRKSMAKATLYHTKMGFLPTQNLAEVKDWGDVSDLMQELIQYSPDIKIRNYKPIIIKKNGKFYLDLNTTQAHANAREIKSRLAKDGGYRVEDLKALGTDMELSGDELKVWKNKLANKSFLDKIG